jgi:uncharacterized protein YrrD
MRFEKGTEVFTASGEKIGTISRIVIDAKTKDVTDLVVERGVFSQEEKVIPVGLVDLQKEDRIMLRETNQDVDDFLDYETTHYVPVEQSGAPYENVEANYWYPPVQLRMQVPRAGLISEAIPDQVPHTESSIPEGRIAITKGAPVVSVDDQHVGNVEQVITGSAGKTVTHFVIGKGLLLKEHKLVPADWVSSLEDEKIRLSVESRLFERLPDYKPDE